MSEGPRWVPVLILFALLGLAYLGMWRGWRRRGRKHDLPPLVACPEEPRDEASRRAAPAVADLPEPRLQAGARYFGTTVSGDWLDRVVARGLGARSSCRISLSDEGLDVIRPAGSFRIPASALRGARHDQGIAGKVVPPHGLLVVTWQHGDHLLDTGFRLTPAGLRRPEPVEGSGCDDAGTTSAPDTSVTEVHDRWVRSISKMAKENA